MKTPVLLALLTAVLLGCSTTAKTSVSLGYAISPLTTDYQEATVTGWTGGATLRFEADRGDAFLGPCIQASYAWSPEPELNYAGTKVASVGHGIGGGGCWLFSLDDD